MSLTIMIAMDLTVFVGVAGLVWFGWRQVEIARGVGRRLRGEAVLKKDSIQPSQLFRQQTVKSPFLVWVQELFLTDSKERQSLTRDLHQAGFDSPSSPAIYKSMQIFLAVVLPVAFVVVMRLSGKNIDVMKMTIVIAVFLGIGYLGPYMFVKNAAQDRQTQLQDQFPDALDLTVVCVEAGLPLEAAFLRVGGDTATSHPRISQEFRTVTEELQAGRTRAEALHSFANRTQVDVVKSFVALLIQTDALGGSIAQSLRVYAAEMRQHRMLRAEEKAMRIPVLLSVPLVLCILPVIVTAVMLPAMITLMTDFSRVVK